MDFFFLFLLTKNSPSHTFDARFQKFYEQGEREMLLGEISELRDQVSE
jgi:hypothetical protein